MTAAKKKVPVFDLEAFRLAFSSVETDSEDTTPSWVFAEVEKATAEITRLRSEITRLSADLVAMTVKYETAQSDAVTFMTLLRDLQEQVQSSDDYKRGWDDGATTAREEYRAELDAARKGRGQ